MKVCTKCEREQPYENFSKRSMVPDGLQSQCKSCDKELREKTKEKRKKYNREYYQRNRSEFLRRAKEYRDNNKEIIAIKHRQYVQENKERLEKYHAEYREKNRKEIRRKQSEYQKRRYDSDVSFCMIERLRSIMQNALKRKGLSKNQRTIESLGCTAEYFKEHIERQFLKGMTWGNRGQWHIDHIIPISSASTEEEIYELSHFTNLRPMWAEDNKRKADKIDSLL